MSHWWLTQWQCVEKQCAYATAWDEDTGVTAKTIVETCEAQARVSGINPWCGICGLPIAPHHERLPDTYQTHEQVYAMMAASQAEQLASRALLDELGATFDVRQRESRN